MLNIRELRTATPKRALTGLTAQVGGTAIAAGALQEPEGGRFWVGGLSLALFSFYRASLFYEPLVGRRLEQGSSAIGRLDWLIITVSGFFAFEAVTTALPEYYRVVTPIVDTCWAYTSSDRASLGRVACWSCNAVIQTIG